MSANSHQRKQELLGRLALSRLELLDEADNLTAKVGQAMQFPGKIGHVVKNHPAVTAVLGIGGGLVLVKLVSMLFGSSKKVVVEGASVRSAKQGVINAAFASLWGMVLASATPVVRHWIQEAVASRLHSVLDGKRRIRG